MHVKKLLVLVCFFGVFKCANAQNSDRIDVYLIGGQSNATGQGYVKNMADSMRIDTEVLIFHSGKPHINSGKQPFTWHALTQASESPDRFGPELGFASKIHQLYPKNKIAIIKHAHSGTNLYHQWDPGANESDTTHWGVQFKAFVQTVDSGLYELRKMGYKPVIKGMLWQQGENDAVPNDSASYRYAQNLTRFISRVRKQYRVSNMPFVYGYVLPPPNSGAERDIVRRAQHDIDESSGSPLAVKKAFVVQTDDLSQRADDKDTHYPADRVHFGTDGAWVLGVRMAEKFTPKQ